MVNPNRFYTYAYLREDRTPYYVGKGCGRRIYCNKGRPCSKPKDKSRIIFLKQNLTEEEAFKHEIYMIDVFGRKDLGTGILYNKTDGGDGASGFRHSEESRKKQSELRKGRKHTEETIKKLSELNSGEKHPQYGKPLSEERKKNHSKRMKGKNHPRYGKSHSEETKRKQSKAMKGRYDGENNPNYGKSPSEETKRKQSEAMKGKREGKYNPNYGKKWWNDGCGNSVLVVECPGEGWFPGRGKLPRKLKALHL